ncbi:hypothetical protein D9M71_504600 [compost metagenome]
MGAHQVEAGQFAAVGFQQIGKGHRTSLEADQGNPEMLQVLGAESAQRKAFLAHILAAQPGVGNNLQFLKRGLPWFMHFQAQAVATTAVPGVAQVFHLLALGVQVKALEIDPRLFAELDRSQADVHVKRQVLGTHLVEHRAGMVHVTQVAELPDHFGTLVRRADRIVQGDQAAASVGVHKEGIVIGMEQQRLVAGQRQAAVGLIRGLQNAVGALQLFGVWQVNHRAGGTQQPGQGDRHQQHCAAQGRAQAARGVGVQGELPPQLMAIGHILIGEQQQPDRRANDAGAGCQIDR